MKDSATQQKNITEGLSETLKNLTTQAIEKLDYQPKNRTISGSEPLQSDQLSGVIDLARRSTGIFSAATGSFGIAGQLVDIPGFYLNALHHTARIAALHGYDLKDSTERQFLLRILAIGHLPTEDERLKALAEVHLPAKKRFMAEEIAGALFTRSATMSVYKFASKLFKQRLKFALPFVGAVSNTAANMSLMNIILDTAVRGYRRRVDFEASVAEDN